MNFVQFPYTERYIICSHTHIHTESCFLLILSHSHSVFVLFPLVLIVRSCLGFIYHLMKSLSLIYAVILKPQSIQWSNQNIFDQVHKKKAISVWPAEWLQTKRQALWSQGHGRRDSHAVPCQSHRGEGQTLMSVVEGLVLTPHFYSLNRVSRLIGHDSEHKKLPLWVIKKPIYYS